MSEETGGNLHQQMCLLSLQTREDEGIDRVAKPSGTGAVEESNDTAQGEDGAGGMEAQTSTVMLLSHEVLEKPQPVAGSAPNDVVSASPASKVETASPAKSEARRSMMQILTQVLNFTEGSADEGVTEAVSGQGENATEMIEKTDGDGPSTFLPRGKIGHDKTNQRRTPYSYATEDDERRFRKREGSEGLGSPDTMSSTYSPKNIPSPQTPASQASSALTEDEDSRLDDINEFIKEDLHGNPMPFEFDQDLVVYPGGQPEIAKPVEKHNDRGPIKNHAHNRAAVQPYPTETQPRRQQPQPIQQSATAKYDESNMSEEAVKLARDAQRTVAHMDDSDLWFRNDTGDSVLHALVEMTKPDVTDNIVGSSTERREYYGLLAVLQRMKREADRDPLCKQQFDEAMNKPNILGQTPLYIAVRSKKPKFAGLLLDFGADPNIMYHCNDNSQKCMMTVVHMAAAAGKDGLQTMRQILTPRPACPVVDLEKKNLECKTALHVAVEKHGETSLLAGEETIDSIQTIKELMKNKAKANSEDGNLSTPLHSAARKINLPLLKAFMEYLHKQDRKIVTNHQDSNGNTCLHVLADLANDPKKNVDDIVKCIQFLMDDCGAEATHTNRHNRLPKGLMRNTRVIEVLERKKPGNLAYNRPAVGMERAPAMPGMGLERAAAANSSVQLFNFQVTSRADTGAVKTTTGRDLAPNVGQRGMVSSAAAAATSAAVAAQPKVMTAQPMARVSPVAAHNTAAATNMAPYAYTNGTQNQMLNPAVRPTPTANNQSDSSILQLLSSDEGPYFLPQVPNNQPLFPTNDIPPNNQPLFPTNDIPLAYDSSFVNDILNGGFDSNEMFSFEQNLQFSP